MKSFAEGMKHLALVSLVFLASCTLTQDWKCHRFDDNNAMACTQTEVGILDRLEGDDAQLEDNRVTAVIGLGNNCLLCQGERRVFRVPGAKDAEHTVTEEIDVDTGLVYRTTTTTRIGQYTVTSVDE